MKCKWRKEEFLWADSEAVTERKRYIIVILFDKHLNIDELPETMKNYMKTCTYIDATKKTKIVKRLRYWTKITI